MIRAGKILMMACVLVWAISIGHFIGRDNGVVACLSASLLGTLMSMRREWFSE